MHGIKSKMSKKKGNNSVTNMVGRNGNRANPGLGGILLVGL